MTMKKLSIDFYYVDTDNKVVRNYEVHPLYDEIKKTFDTCLGFPIEVIKEKFVEEHIDFRSEKLEIPMEKLTLTYNVSWNDKSHIEALINLLENLDLDLNFQYHE